MVQPAPRMKKAPAANLLMRSRSGSAPAGATMAMLHQQGQRRSQVPAGLSTRASSRYGLKLVGALSTHDFDDDQRL